MNWTMATATVQLLIIGFVTRRMPLVELELPTHREHLHTPRMLVGFMLLGFLCSVL